MLSKWSFPSFSDMTIGNVKKCTFYNQTIDFCKYVGIAFLFILKNHLYTVVPNEEE